MGMHRRRRLGRAVRRTAVVAGWGLAGLSVLLAIFVHRGLLGIAALVAAVAVGWMMLHPNRWRRLAEYGPEVTEESPD
jgi:hypothetical protein